MKLNMFWYSLVTRANCYFVSTGPAAQRGQPARAHTPPPPSAPSPPPHARAMTRGLHVAHQPRPVTVSRIDSHWWLVVTPTSDVTGSDVPQASEITSNVAVSVRGQKWHGHGPQRSLVTSDVFTNVTESASVYSIVGHQKELILLR